MAKNRQQWSQQIKDESSPNGAETAVIAPQSSTTGTDTGGIQIPTGITVAPAAPLPAAATGTGINQSNSSANPVPNLDELLASMTPEQLAKLSGLAAAEGLGIGSKPSTKLPDGSLIVSVTLPPDIVVQLEAWCEDGRSLEEEAQTRISEALTAFLYGDWGAAAVKAEPVTTAAATTTTVGA